jgi:hypothetical protein
MVDEMRREFFLRGYVSVASLRTSKVSWVIGNGICSSTALRLISAG